MQEHDGRAVPEFISAALAAKPIPIFGKGQQTRSFNYIDDEVDGLLRLLYSEHVGPINIGNPHEVTILQIAETIKKLTKSRSRIVFKPLPVDDPRVRQPDITRAKNLLGWEPHTSLESGLKQTIAWFRQKKAGRTH
jgi:dTDP-glucose 4,6-dehydratase